MSMNCWTNDWIWYMRKQVKEHNQRAMSFSEGVASGLCIEDSDLVYSNMSWSCDCGESMIVNIFVENRHNLNLYLNPVITPFFCFISQENFWQKLSHFPNKKGKMIYSMCIILAYDQGYYINQVAPKRLFNKCSNK